MGLYMFSLVFLLFPFLLSCLLCDSFCLLPFCLRFSVHLTFSFPICFFPAAFSCLSSFCLSSCDFFPPANCILHHPFCIFIRRFRFPVWFCALERSQNEGKNEGKIHDNQLGMDMARSWQTFFPILPLLRELPLPLRGLVMLLLQAFV